MRSLLIFIFGFSAFANAASDSSTLEYFYQTPEGKQQLTPSLVYHDVKYRFKSGNKTDGSGFDLNLQYERGISAMFSVGGIVSYKTGTLNSNGGGKIEANGLGDLILFFKGHADLLEGRYLWFGANLSISPGDFEKKNKGAIKENMYSGEHKLIPYLGYSMLVTESLTFGAKVSTQINLGDGTEKATNNLGVVTTSKTSGDEVSTLSLFLESPIEKGNFGGEVAYDGRNTKKSVANNGITHYDGYNTLKLGVYGTHDFSEDFTLRGELSYKTIISNVSTLSSSTFIDASVAGRFTF